MDHIGCLEAFELVYNLIMSLIKCSQVINSISMLVMTVPEWLVERGSILITGNISFKSNIFLRWLCSLVVVTVKRIVGREAEKINRSWILLHEK